MPGPALPDLLYIVGTHSSSHHEELRYSLRSVCQHLPHRKLVVVGHAPPWLTGAVHVPCSDRHHMPVRNTLRKLQVAVESGELGERFVLMNDDFYLLRPWDADAPALADGLLRHRVQDRGFATADHEQLLVHTLKLLEGEGFAEPLNHDVHRPLTMEVSKVQAMLARFGRADLRTVYAWRSTYAALHRIPTDLAPNTKQRRVFVPPGPDVDVLSVDEVIAADAGFMAWCRSRWGEMCRYEH